MSPTNRKMFMVKVVKAEESGEFSRPSAVFNALAPFRSAGLRARCHTLRKDAGGMGTHTVHTQTRQVERRAAQEVWRGALLVSRPRFLVFFFSVCTFQQKAA